MSLFVFFFSKEFSGTINAEHNMRTKCNKLFFDKFTLIWNSGFRFCFHIHKCINDAEQPAKFRCFYNKSVEKVI